LGYTYKSTYVLKAVPTNTYYVLLASRWR